MENQIFNESCMDTMSRMGEGTIDLVVTSPPYFNAREYSQYSDVSSYMAEMREIFTEVYRVLGEARFLAVNISPVLISREKRNDESRRVPLPFYYVPMLEEIGFLFLEDIIWKKPDGAVYNRTGKFSTHLRPRAYKPNLVTEYILVFRKPSEKILDAHLKEGSLVGESYERTNVWEMNPETHSEHSAPFPEALPHKLIEYYSYEGEIVYDPFLGSGTTAKMAKVTKRKYIGSEINEGYFKIAQKRLDHTQEYFF